MLRCCSAFPSFLKLFISFLYAQSHFPLPAILAATHHPLSYRDEEQKKYRPFSSSQNDFFLHQTLSGGEKQEMIGGQADAVRMCTTTLSNLYLILSFKQCNWRRLSTLLTPIRTAAHQLQKGAKSGLTPSETPYATLLHTSACKGPPTGLLGNEMGTTYIEHMLL